MKNRAIGIHAELSGDTYDVICSLDNLAVHARRKNIRDLAAEAKGRLSLPNSPPNLSRAYIRS